MKKKSALIYSWKNVWALALTLILVLSLAGCGGSAKKNSEENANAETGNVTASDVSAKDDGGGKDEDVPDPAADAEVPPAETGASGLTQEAAVSDLTQSAEAAASGLTQETEAAASGLIQEAETAASGLTQEAETAALGRTQAAAEVREDAAPDYSLAENWAYDGIGEDKAVDLFLVCPTVDTRDEYNMSLDDEEVKTSFFGALNMERGIYEDTARMYAPYYRQAAIKIYSLERDEWEAPLSLAYSDVSAAFSYYLDNKNQGRPIILAGFSQGSDMCLRLMEEYFGDEKLKEQLVAVYAIGWPCTEETVREYPQIRPARSAEDTGVVISFDCEAPGLEETFINPAGQKAYSINPLSWETDSAPADKSLNPGACFTSYSGEIMQEVPGLCGCYIDEDRGVLKVTDVSPSDYPPILSCLPEGSYHIFDYQFFFRNLQQNVALRTAKYLGE